MVLSPKLREYEGNIVKYGISVPVAGVRDGGDREIRDIALVMGAMLNLPKPTKAGLALPPAAPDAAVNPLSDAAPLG